MHNAHLITEVAWERKYVGKWW